MTLILRSAAILTSGPCSIHHANAQTNHLPPYSETITTSLATSIRHYRVENGRTYHQYKDGRKPVLQCHLASIEVHVVLEYAYPNDEPEKDRLGMIYSYPMPALSTHVTIDLQHHLYRLTLDEKLYLAPIKDDVQDVLDIGTGTGLWAIEFGSC